MCTTNTRARTLTHMHCGTGRQFEYHSSWNMLAVGTCTGELCIIGLDDNKVLSKWEHAAGWANESVLFQLAPLCCAVLCCGVLCCGVLDCAVLCCAVVCCGVLCYAVVCCTVLWCAGPYCTVVCCAVLCCTVVWCAVLCCAVLYCGVLCSAVVCGAVLCGRIGYYRPSILIIIIIKLFFSLKKINSKKYIYINQTDLHSSSEKTRGN